MKNTMKSRLSLLLILATLASCLLVPATATSNFVFLLQTKTALEPGGNNFQFVVGDYNHDSCMDVYAVKMVNTGCGRTEVHVIDGSDRSYTRYLLQTGVPLETGNNFRFSINDFNGDGFQDLAAIKVQNTGSPYAEIHILDGSPSSNFQNFLLQTRLPIECGNYWDFDMGKNGNLYCFKKESTGSGKAEVHSLSRQSKYQTFVLQRALPIELGNNWTYRIGNFGGTGDDIFAFKTSNTGTGRTEIHILSASSNYSSFVIQSATELETGNNFIFNTYDFDRNGYDDVAAIKRAGGISKSEVHVFSLAQRNVNTNTDGMSWPMSRAYCTWRTPGPNMSWGQYTSTSSGRNYHLGCDIYGTNGTVYSAGNGTVAKAGWNNANGNYVVIRHTVNGKTIYSFYAHLQSYQVAENQPVSKGQEIGVAGSTGSSTSAVHLHFALVDTLWNGSYYGYATSFTGNSVYFNGVTYYNPKYVIENGRLP